MRSKNKISHKMMAVLVAALIVAMLLTSCGGGGGGGGGSTGGGSSTVEPTPTPTPTPTFWILISDRSRKSLNTKEKNILRRLLLKRWLA